MKPRVYVETTIPSYLTAWLSRDLIRAAHQQITQEWWRKRDDYELYSSRLVVQECREGDPKAAADRLAALAGIPLLKETNEVSLLAEALLRDVPLPQKAASDAVHIATAAVHRMSYLVTWNCTHIANATLRARIESVCRNAGFEPPLICTPEELIGGGGEL
jgi:predicted nucleic acid-binding protein